MVPFSFDQSWFLEAPLVQQADSELKNSENPKIHDADYLRLVNDAPRKHSGSTQAKLFEFQFNLTL